MIPPSLKFFFEEAGAKLPPPHFSTLPRKPKMDAQMGRWEAPASLRRGVSLSTVGTLPAVLPFPFPLFYSEVPKGQPFIGC